MRIENLIELAKSSLKLGIYVCGAVILLYIFGYLLLYRVYLLGKKKIPVIYVLWAMIMCWYVAVIVNVTLVTGCELIYELDSKGYLQPDYEFSCMINGRENKIIIPALK